MLNLQLSSLKIASKKVPVPVEEIKKNSRLLSQEELKMYANWLLKILDEIPPPN